MPVCYFGRACRRTRPICLSMLSCRTPLTARCCASRVVPCTPASLKPSRPSSPISLRVSLNYWRAYTEAGLIEKAVSFWRTAGQRSLARSALLEGAEQLKRALDQITTLPATPALRREEIKLQGAFANALSLMGDFVDGKLHYDRALAIYDPAEQRPLTKRGRDVGVTLLSARSGCLWALGYPAASRNDADRAV